MKRVIISQPRESGQILVIVVIALIVLLVVIGVAVDVALYLNDKLEAQSNISTACLVAANASYHGYDVTDSFTNSLAANNVPPERFSPTQGSGLNLERGLEQGGVTMRAAMLYEHTTFFLQIIGLRQFPVLVRSHCIIPLVGITPIAIKECIFELEDAHPGLEYSIVGDGDNLKPHELDVSHTCVDKNTVAPDDSKGEPFVGVIFPQMWCVDANGNPDQECQNLRIFPPLEEEPSSPQTVKEIIGGCFAGMNCNMWAPVGTHLPIVKGMTQPEVCKAYADNFEIGQRIAVIVYSGEVFKPSSGSTWSNVEVLYYAIYEITDFARSNTKNCNGIVVNSLHNCTKSCAKRVSGALYAPEEIPINRYSREIPWDYSGALP